MSTEHQDADITGDIPVSDNYVQQVLRTTKPSPPITWKNWYKEVNWLQFTIIAVPNVVSVIGTYFVKLRLETLLFTIFYGHITGIGITAGYHRLWSHRSYVASRALQYYLAVVSAGALQSHIWRWCKHHRAHHRYTDTELDPYNAQMGFWWSHVGWLFVKSRRKQGRADISDLAKNDIVQWQLRYYVPLAILIAFVVPVAIPWFFWDDFIGGVIYAVAWRISCVHHGTFCVNSLAHWFGDMTFDDEHTARDHFITALVSIGEGYHNFHHQFPTDYRNAHKWYQYDPTKWFIWACQKLGLASHLNVFPENEVQKAQLTMQLKKLRELQNNLLWPTEHGDLPIINWKSFQEQSQERPLIAISGFIHDVSNFMNQHPGGPHLLKTMVGKDATTAFFGGVYDHSSAAHNLLAMKRVGILYGGTLHGTEEMIVPLSQRLKVARWTELNPARVVKE